MKGNIHPSRKCSEFGLINVETIYKIWPHALEWVWSQVLAPHTVCGADSKLSSNVYLLKLI